MTNSRLHARSESRPWRVSARLLIVFSGLCLLAFSAICASVLMEMRRGEEALARQTMENMAATIDADISRNIELYDLSLRNVALNLFDPEVQRASRAVRQMILFDHMATARHFGAIQVFDARGNLILDSSTIMPAAANRADEEYFEVHRDSADRGLYISRPGLHRGSYSVVLSRRVSGEDGSFLGVVTGSIRFSYFHDLFGRLQLRPDETITVFRKDGVVIMRTPFDLDLIGKDFSSIPQVRRTLIEPSGSVTRHALGDGVLRLYVWRDSGHPLLVVVGRSWEGIFELWRRQVLWIGGAMLVMILLVAAATFFLAREINRRAAAEDRLEELATTDPLTGLKNRRKFDAVLDEEWRRAWRSNEPLALLMIDADHFKSLNDMLGHQAGDQVLIVIADAIRASARRAGDCTARFGGEEFAVLLPGLAADRALPIAETIRSAVAEHRTAGQALVSVSIGVASIKPSSSVLPERLVEAADKALYEAKSQGRNRCCVAQTAGRVSRFQRSYPLAAISIRTLETKGH